MRTLLALETSGPRLSVAVSSEKSGILEAEDSRSFSHAEKLLPLISELLAQAGKKMPDVETILIGRGPGSFTGLRVGFATLKGFRAVDKTPCFGILSCDAMALSCSLDDGSRLAVCQDAYRQKIYTKFFMKTNGHLLSEGPLQLHTQDEILSTLEKKLMDSPLTVTGDALKRYPEKFAAVRRAKLLPESHWYPSAKCILECYQDRILADTFFKPLNTPDDFIPFYFRLSEAEEKRHENANAL